MTRLAYLRALCLAAPTVALFALLPATASANWSIQPSVLPSAIIVSSSCPATDTCVQVNTTGRVAYTTNSGTSWTLSANTIAGVPRALDCPSTSLCFVTSSNGNIYRSVNLGASWTTSFTDTPALYGLDCPSTSVCYAGSGSGDIIKTVNGGTSWTGPFSTTGAILYSFSCPSTTVCYAIGAAGDIYKKNSANDTWPQVATSAQISDVISPYSTGLSCPSLLVCFVGGTDGTIARTTNGGGSWGNVTTGTTPDIYAIACASELRCIAVGVANRSSYTENGGTTWDSTRNTGSAAAMYSVTWAGAGAAFAGDAIGKPYRFAAPSPPDADVDVSETLNPGGLSFIDATPANVTFPNTALTNANQMVNAAQPITIADATGSGSGWSISVTSTTFTTGSRTLDNDATNVVAAPTIACKAATTCTPAVNAVTYPLTLPAAGVAPPALKLYNAAVGSGLGAQTITPTWRLTVPATTYAGTYTSTWTYTLTSGP